MRAFLANSKLFFRTIDSLSRKRTIGMVLLMVLVSIVELVGLGIVIPVAAILLDEKATLSDGAIRSVWLFLGSPDRTTFILIGMLALLATFLFRALILAGFSWIQAGYTQSIRYDFSKRLFRKYINLDLLDRRQRSSADFLRVLGVELNIFIDNVIGPALVVVAETFVMVTVVSLLVFFQPTAAVTIGIVFILSMASFSVLTRNKVSKWSSERQDSDKVRMKVAKEALDSMVEIKSLGRERVFANEFEIKTSKSLSINRKYTFISQLPRFWMETSAVGALSIALSWLVIQGEPVDSVMASLGLFAVAAFRLLPSANRLVANIQSIKFGISSFSHIISETKEESEVDLQDSAENEVTRKFRNITITNLSFAYPQSRSRGLYVPSFSVSRGQIVGISGPSGSGKTTFIDTLIGLITPIEGSIKLDGKSIDFGASKHKSLFSYVNQAPYMLDRTLEENIVFGQPAKDVDELLLDHVIEIAQLSELRKSIIGSIGDSGSKLSGGQKQRVAIARALYKESPVLVLDEGTSALDKKTELEFFAAIELLSKSKTIVLITHDKKLLGKCDLVYVLSGGVLKLASD